ncbi:DUF4124 domain-containing protein [Aerolutibacter ruishenii]|uniref:Uncharacterized protein DUF4124 n=1 Tax=Aerolutibacter ruishenii TaxID=686800 RepID=A0A562M2S6_9GAMM|nr:DUF4124 domain-containing protein [Lysobacter ruishenii]TWI14234.1 uncharacterized protein DUF4124 [Lysobacter ruishenii]
MPRPASRISAVPVVLAAAVLVALALPAAASKVYQWKDARGVTHYADAPPPGQKAEQRSLQQRAPAAPAKAVVNADCSNARSNLAVLKGSGPVGLDADRDGKHERELTPAERAERTTRAEAAVKTYCEGGTLPPVR